MPSCGASPTPGWPTAGATSSWANRCGAWSTGRRRWPSTAGAGWCWSSGRMSRSTPASLLGAEVHPQSEDAVVQAALGVAEHGEVHVVEPGLLDEPCALRPLDGGHAPAPDRLGPFPEAPDHGVHVEFLGHAGDATALASHTSTAPLH